MTESEKLILSAIPDVAAGAFFVLPEDARRKALSEAGAALDANGVLSLDRFIEICANNDPDCTVGHAPVYQNTLVGWKGET